MTSKELENRYDMCLIFDVTDGNPNGDPDAGNLPRTDPETLQGLVSDVCQKRKVRDYVIAHHSGEPAMEIFFRHQTVLNPQIDEAHEKAELSKDVDLKKDKTAKNIAAREWLCSNRYDIRTFGAVLTTGKNAGQVRGPVQCTFARSIDPILSLEACITRKSVTDQKEADKQINKDGYITGTMGRKSLVPYALYRSHWFVNPMLAAQTGFSFDDFKVLCDALLNMWEDDRSAARGMMATRRLTIFAHEGRLGTAPSHHLMESIKIVRRDKGVPPRRFDDYAVDLERNGWVEKVKVFELTNPEDYSRLFG